MQLSTATLTQILLVGLQVTNASPIPSPGTATTTGTKPGGINVSLNNLLGNKGGLLGLGSPSNGALGGLLGGGGGVLGLGGGQGSLLGLGGLLQGNPVTPPTVPTGTPPTIPTPPTVPTGTPPTVTPPTVPTGTPPTPGTGGGLLDLNLGNILGGSNGVVGGLLGGGGNGVGLGGVVGGLLNGGTGTPVPGTGGTGNGLLGSLGLNNVGVHVGINGGKPVASTTKTP